MFDADLIQKLTVYALPVLFAITLHEAAHAYAAKRFGDATAFMMGRMTLNPLKHIDPIGTILVPLLCLWLGGFMFGWAKPVPVNFSALTNPRVHTRWVAAAGPLANFIMVIGWALLLKLALAMPHYFALPLALMSQAGMVINLSLMVLNLLPILPLDGGRIVETLLPQRVAWYYSRLEPYGLWILLALIYFNILGLILGPVMTVMYEFIRALMS